MILQITPFDKFIQIADEVSSAALGRRRRRAIEAIVAAVILKEYACGGNRIPPWGLALRILHRFSWYEHVDSALKAAGRLDWG